MYASVYHHAFDYYCDRSRVPSFTHDQKLSFALRNAANTSTSAASLPSPVTFMKAQTLYTTPRTKVGPDGGAGGAQKGVGVQLLAQHARHGGLVL